VLGWQIMDSITRIEIRERRIYPKEVCTVEDVLSLVGDDEREFIEFILRPKEELLSRAVSTRKFKRFKSAYTELFITFTVNVIGEIAAMAIWDWIKKRFESAKDKDARTIFRVKISYREQERTFTIEEPHVKEKLIEIKKSYEELTKS
jgi:hypothetical protein